MAVIKYYVEARSRGGDSEAIASTWLYEEVHNPYKPGKPLSRDAARGMIKEKGLVLVHSCRYGQIWDSPDEPLKERYGVNN